ncbi:hydrolase Cof [Heyndrickxia shackletonii]|uniref:Hydrolase Cof n=1 Tax=Heyndrickxia shackletonii TaxID=157838 RepID=A0A0Q3WR08_9BACI|nr:Cof-type HAD-IIB family hydrolase [Heyndrickxia shackletonii]KQL51469.1 hydrolase Cof [Heyndrickxia shackletonii]NEZ02408.1 Cof-type HAD-IIB family hydrolase [Heyndrickxia shackletonii]
MKLIAIDLDGTLLSEDGTISSTNAEAIRDVQKQGDIITICSGRSLHDTQAILENAGIDCPVITGNGAIAYHGNEIIRKLIIPDNVILELIPFLESEGFYFELYTNQGIHLLTKGKEQLDEEIRSLLEKDANFPFEWANKERDIQFQQFGLHYINDYKDINIPELEVYKIFVLSFNREKLVQLENNLRNRQDISLTSSGSTKLEIAHAEVSKGNALTYMANFLNIPLKDTVAIGDNLNDISMFKVAGMSIAMGNAVEEAKKISTYTTKKFNEDGVAYALRNYVMET